MRRPHSASFNAARMVGPAVAGMLIAAIGEGWLFMRLAIQAVPIEETDIRVAAGERVT